MLQDNKGFIWMGTQVGLNRFDGSKFAKYYSQPIKSTNIYNDLVRTSFKDSKGNLWFGTMDDGISKYNEDSDDFTTYILSSGNGDNNSEFITSITEDSKGRIWAGTRNNGIWVMNDVASEFSKIELRNPKTGKKIESITSVLFDFDNRMWVGTWNKGLFIFNAEWNMVLCANESDQECKISSNYIRCLMKDLAGHIWVGMDKGLCVMDTNTFNIREVKLTDDKNDQHKVTSLSKGKNQDLWIGTLDAGLFQLSEEGTVRNYRTDSNKTNTLSDNAVLSLLRDSSDVLWIGTVFGGATKLDPDGKPFRSLFRFQHNGQHKTVMNVQSVLEKRCNSIFVGTHRDGIFLFDGKKEYMQAPDWYKDTLDEITGQMVLGIIEDTIENVWICTFNEIIYKINFREKKVDKFIIENSGGILCMYLYDGHIILGTDRGGLRAIDIEKNELQAFKPGSKLNGFLINKTIFVVLIDRENQMWIGTKNDGLFRFDIDKNEMFTYKNSEIEASALRDNCIISLFESSDGKIWVGTKSGGLHYYESSLSVLIPINSGTLDRDSIRGFSEDSLGRLWISTINGIVRYDHSNNSSRMYDTSDGELSSEYNEMAVFTSSAGVVYFGGVDGVTYFNPEEIKDNPHIPNIVLTDFEIFNKPVIPSPDNPFLKKNITYADEINLTYRESVFSFGFAALIFNNPQKNQYAYKMEGFDKDWTYCGKRKRVTYTNLDPGQYIFRVKGSNNDGIWNEEGTSIRINISPPYWQTWWFRTLGALAAIAATGLTYKQRLDKMEKEKQSQEEFSRRLIESQEDERKRVSSELHHTVAHDVLIAKNKAQMALKHKDDAGKMEQALREITDLATSTMKDVRNISYNLHPHQLEQLGFTKSLKSIITEVSKSTEINFKFEIDDVDKLLKKEYEINLFRAIQESVTNVLKHSEAKDSFLKVSRSRDFVFIVLTDNGKGFDTKNFKLTDKKNGLGIKNISERIKLMKGEYKIESNPGKGTTVIYKIPIKDRNEKQSKSNSGG
jgi:signal transduction histidine kinase/ligand-binding sensor domain-containing protein